MAQAMDRPNAITYVKGTAAVRQLAALIGPDAVAAGLTDYLTRFAGGGARVALTTGAWLVAGLRPGPGRVGRRVAARAGGTPHLAARLLTAAPDGTVASLTVTQDLPRPHRVRVALYDADEGDLHGLRHRRTEWAELACSESGTARVGRRRTAARRRLRQRRVTGRSPTSRSIPRPARPRSRSPPLTRGTR